MSGASPWQQSHSLSLENFPSILMIESGMHPDSQPKSLRWRQRRSPMEGRGLTGALLNRPRPLKSRVSAALPGRSTAQLVGPADCPTDLVSKHPCCVVAPVSTLRLRDQGFIHDLDSPKTRDNRGRVDCLTDGRRRRRRPGERRRDHHHRRQAGITGSIWTSTCPATGTSGSAYSPITTASHPKGFQRATTGGRTRLDSSSDPGG
jgi:hypothetical protein